MPGYFTYSLDELIDHINYIDFDGEPDSHSRAEPRLRELYYLPNINEDKSALIAAAEYAASREGDVLTLEQVEEYAKRFAFFYEDWKEAAREHLKSMIGQEIITYLPYMDLERLGRAIKDDEGFFKVSDGRIACYN